MGSTYHLLLSIVIVVYFAISKLIFDEVHNSIQIVIDEMFHIPQGLAYCNWNFTYWDQKITTLPGLYLVSTAFLGSYFECNPYNLRFINLIASCVNLLLFLSIINYIYSGKKPFHIVLQALNLSILPPLYFFSHVYYTDTLSLTFLLAFFRLCFTNNYKLLMLILGICSVLMRQTNVVWIAMVFIRQVSDIFIKSSRVYGNKNLQGIYLSKNSPLSQDIDNSKLRRYYGFKDLVLALRYHLDTHFCTLFKFITLNNFMVLLTHSITLISFVAFVLINGSVVVGDKKAHEATIHLPQLLYFLLFYGAFGLPYVIARIPSTLRLIFKNKTKVMLLSLLAVLIVHFNTVVHPYLLADNRHFTFYVWNRWFGKYEFAIYATVPVYIFLLFSLYDNLKGQNCVTFLLPYTVCLCLVLSLQKMIEVRYFLIPYIILRLRFIPPSYYIVLFEFLWYTTLNYLMFNLFFSKTIFWKDFDYAQRIVW